MSFLISTAYAAATPAAPAAANGESWMNSLWILIIFFGIMYFIFLRPQTKRMKAHQQLVESLKVGDEVVTSGGLLGKITRVESSIIFLEIAENTVIKVRRAAISLVLPKESLGSSV